MNSDFSVLIISAIYAERAANKIPSRNKHGQLYAIFKSLGTLFKKGLTSNKSPKVIIMNTELLFKSNPYKLSLTIVKYGLLQVN